MAFTWTDGFETDLGNWNQAAGDSGDWIRGNAGTPSGNTGPSAGNPGFYMWIETSSPIQGGNTFILESDVIDGSVNLVTGFTFDEHMAGQDMDDFNSTLQVQAWDGAAWNTIYTQTGQNGAIADGLGWQAKDALSAVADLDAAPGGPYTNADLQIRFLYTLGGTGTQFQNDCGLDNIVVTAVDRLATEQEGYRWRDDDGSESAATWRELQDTPDTVGKGTNIRLRTLVDAAGNAPTQQATLQYKRDDEPATEWRDV